MTSVKIIDMLQKYIVRGPRGEYRDVRKLASRKDSHFRWADFTGDTK